MNVKNLTNIAIYVKRNAVACYVRRCIYASRYIKYKTNTIGDDIPYKVCLFGSTYYVLHKLFIISILM